MARISVTNHVTLDGVMQSPASADEDRRGGFERGGWAAHYGDEVMDAVMAEGMAREGSLLLGRHTYEHFAAYWPKQTDGNPYTEVLNRTQKYVASTTLEDPLPWENSTVLRGDIPAAVATLKDELDQEIVILGSGELIRSLLPHGLIDEYLLTIHPLVLGQGQRLFGDDGAYAELQLVDTKPTTTGVIIARYRTVPDRSQPESRG
jgi:dihydrofolate reductase